MPRQHHNEKLNIDAKVIIPSHHESYPNLTVCQNNCNMILLPYQASLVFRIRGSYPAVSHLLKIWEGAQWGFDTV